MHFQTNILSLLLLALVLVSCVDASANKKRKRNAKSKEVSILSDDSTGRGDALTLLASLTLKSRFKPKHKPAPLLVDTTNIVPAVQPGDQDALVQSVPEGVQVSGRGEQTKKLELISKNQREKATELGKETRKNDLERLCARIINRLDSTRTVGSTPEDPVALLD